MPADAKAFWAYVDRACDDEDLGAASFLERVHRRHFYFGAADGAKRDFLHHRAVRARVQRHGRRQGVDALRRDRRRPGRQGELRRHAAAPRLDGRVPIWPMDPLPGEGSVVVEIYTRAFIRLAGLSGRKVRSDAELNLLAALGSAPARLGREPSDHETDVLIAAAGLRRSRATRLVDA